MLGTDRDPDELEVESEEEEDEDMESIAEEIGVEEMALEGVAKVSGFCWWLAHLESAATEGGANSDFCCNDCVCDCLGKSWLAQIEKRE